MQSLSEVRAGESCQIKWMFGAPQVRAFMEQYGIEEGSTVNVFRQGRDGMVIGRGPVRIALGHEIAERIKV